jgi:ABC-type transporter Mla subunit MlaD
VVGEKNLAAKLDNIPDYSALKKEHLAKIKRNTTKWDAREKTVSAARETSEKAADTLANIVKGNPAILAEMKRSATIMNAFSDRFTKLLGVMKEKIKAGDADAARKAFEDVLDVKRAYAAETKKIDKIMQSAKALPELTLRQILSIRL